MGSSGAHWRNVEGTARCPAASSGGTALSWSPLSARLDRPGRPSSDILARLRPRQVCGVQQQQTPRCVVRLTVCNSNKCGIARRVPASACLFVWVAEVISLSARDLGVLQRVRGEHSAGGAAVPVLHSVVPWCCTHRTVRVSASRPVGPGSAADHRPMGHITCAVCHAEQRPARRGGLDIQLAGLASRSS